MEESPVGASPVSRWFRFYADAMRSPKVAALSDNDFRLWVELLAVASENDGHIPPLESLKHVLKRRLDHLLRGLNGLIRAGLMDALADGYEPHNWAKFQYKSDTSNERVAKFRAKRNVSRNTPRTETDTELPIAKAIVKARAPEIEKPDDVSDQTWQDFERHRHAKKAPITETVLAAFRREADRIGWTLEAALIETVARDWRGFKASWVEEKQNGRTNTDRQTAPNGRAMGRTEAAAREVLARMAGPGQHGGCDDRVIALPNPLRADRDDDGRPDRVADGGGW
jgi:hypothetical protein